MDAKKTKYTMKASTIDFFLKNIEALNHFIKKMKEDFGQTDLVFVLKMFVVSSNKIFNMEEYMKNQSKQAEEYVKSKKKNLTAKERHTALNHWIEKNAEQFRKQAIIEQIYCIDKMHKEIISKIKQVIEK